MKYNRFRRPAKLSKKSVCNACGKESKLIKRTNYPHGIKSGGRCFTLYKCNDCNKELFVKIQ